MIRIKVILRKMTIMLVSLFVFACASVATQPPNVGDGLLVVDMHVAAPRAESLRIGELPIVVADIAAYVRARLPEVDRWVLHLPDNLPIEAAIFLFRQFEIASCKNLSVYSNRPDGSWAERELGVSLGPADPIQIIALYLRNEPTTIEKLRANHYPYPLYAPFVPFDALAKAAGPLIALLPEKHIRIHENGSLLGMPAQTYVDTLERLRSAGAELVSFFGVYLE